MQLMDIIRELVFDVFKRNKQFEIYGSSILAQNGTGEITIYNNSGDMRRLYIYINSEGAVMMSLNYVLHWIYNVKDPSGIDNIRKRLVEFANTKAVDMEPDDRLIKAAKENKTYSPPHYQ
jgi:hypothetical protein